MRLFLDHPLVPKQTLSISDAPFNHAIRVLRKKEGDALILFNGLGGEYSATITTVRKKEMIVYIDTFQNINRESSLSIHLIQALSKGERMDYTIQKAVELGVQHITVLTSDRSVVALNSERYEKKLTHWQTIIQSACEQSGRNICPILDNLNSSKDLEQKLSASTYLLFTPTAQMTLGQFIRSASGTIQKIGLIVGPEGGFSNDEIHRFLQSPNVTSISLGTRILRTETAALSILGGLHTLIGDWQ